MKRTIEIAVLGLVFLASHPASAEMSPFGPYTGVPAGTSAGSVLFSQLDEPSGVGHTDQAFEAQYAGYNSEGADDFIIVGPPPAIGASVLWELDSLYTAGSLSGTSPNPSFVNIRFYDDAGGAPGNVECEFPAQTDFTSDSGNLTIDVSGCDLWEGPGETRIWFSQQVRMNFDGSDENRHLWATRTVPNGEPGVWRNPGNAWLTGCTDWQPGASCGVTGADWLFEISGTATEEPGFIEGPVPAVDPFGVVVLVLALGGGSAYVLRRGRKRGSGCVEERADIGDPVA